MTTIAASASIQAIFDEFKNKIIDPNYYPNTPIETLKSRMTAVSSLVSDDQERVEKAAAFIKRTSTSKEEDLQRLNVFAAGIKAWLAFEICSIYTNANGLGPFVEYKMRVATEQGEKLIHYHALYNIENDQCCYISQMPPLIRVIGDPILHQPGKRFPDNPSAEETAELYRQIEQAQAILIETSGAGIASNQCATIESPYQFAIVGVFRDNPAHVQGVKRRYPDATFPAAMIMVNPKITSHSEAMQKFKHACLSVPSANRCEVQSPKEMTVEYLDSTRELALTKKVFKGIDAVVLWHEMNHILDGKTYIDTALASLTPADLAKFEQLVNIELEQRSVALVIPELTVPPFYFTITINEQGHAQLDEATLAEVLPKLTVETLNGFQKQCHALNTKAAAEKKSIEALLKGGHFAGAITPEKSNDSEEHIKPHGPCAGAK